MAKIIKVASATSTPHITSKFKVSKNSTTNPFKYQNFEGNALDITAFADVFESSALKETSKIRMIASSVAGSMHKLRTGISEPIVNFVNRVCEGVSSVWDYAKNTNVSEIGAVKGFNSLMNKQIEIPGLNKLDEVMHKEIEIPGLKKVDEIMHKPIEFSQIGLVGNGIKERVNEINEGIVGFGKGVSEAWNSVLLGLKGKERVSSTMSVSELEGLWKSEISGEIIEEVA